MPDRLSLVEIKVLSAGVHGVLKRRLSGVTSKTGIETCLDYFRLSTHSGKIIDWLGTHRSFDFDIAEIWPSGLIKQRLFK